ncbi:MAG: hypothetical protein Q4D62_14800 [Planctomycetia bacterium]|nr:hypothetical protein [Planctomycetia bacterium]
MNLEQLPLLCFDTRVVYEGSIDKTGGNIDQVWFQHQDKHGDWVLMETEGPGCIYNFAQHHFPESASPTFRFYFDDDTEPRLELRPEDLGHVSQYLWLANSWDRNRIISGFCAISFPCRS